MAEAMATTIRFWTAAGNEFVDSSPGALDDWQTLTSVT
jgi:hypothetical protein